MTMVRPASLVEMGFVDLKVPATIATCLLWAGAPWVPVQRMRSFWETRILYFSLDRKTPFQIESDLENCSEEASNL